MIIKCTTYTNSSEVDGVDDLKQSICLIVVDKIESVTDQSAVTPDTPTVITTVGGDSFPVTASIEDIAAAMKQWQVRKTYEMVELQ